MAAEAYPLVSESGARLIHPADETVHREVINDAMVVEPCPTRELGTVASRLLVQLLGEDIRSLRLTTSDGDIASSVLLTGYEEYIADTTKKEKYDEWLQKIVQGISLRAIVEATQPLAPMHDLTNFLTSIKKRLGSQDFDAELALSILQWKVVQRRNPNLDVSIIMPEPKALVPVRRRKAWGANTSTRIKPIRGNQKERFDDQDNLLYPEKDPDIRLNQLFEMVYGDVPDPVMRRDVEFDDEVRELFVDAIMKEIYDKHAINTWPGTKKRLERIRRYFEVVELTDDELQWFSEAEHRLVDDLRHFSTTLRRGLTNAKMAMAKSDDPGQTVSALYAGYFRPYFDDGLEDVVGDEGMSRLLDLDIDDDDKWQEKALCAQTDPEAFFPEKGGSTREAKKICAACEVKDRCLDYALAHDERFGIWGGLSERERRRLKRGVL